MKLPIDQVFDAAPDRVFASLLDPAVLVRIIDGCQKMDRTAPSEYDVELKVGIAGLKGSYTGKVRILEQDPPRSLTLSLEGKGAPGFVKATARLSLSPQASGTHLAGECDATVGGLIAAVGSRLIEAAAKKMSADFFARLGAQLNSPRAS